MSETTNTAIVLSGVSITKTVSLKTDKDMADSDKKKIKLLIDFEGVTIAAVIEAAVRADVIKWQAANRDKFDTLIDGSTVNRKFAAPPVSVMSDEQIESAMVTKLSNMTPEDALAEIAKLSEKAQAIIDAKTDTTE